MNTPDLKKALAAAPLAGKKIPQLTAPTEFTATAETAGKTTRGRGVKSWAFTLTPADIAKVRQFSLYYMQQGLKVTDSAIIRALIRQAEPGPHLLPFLQADLAADGRGRTKKE